MFTLNAESELPKMFEQLKGIGPEKWPKILANAANQTAFYVLNGYQKDLPSFFHNPTPFTINSMFVQKATPSNLEASVQWKAPASGNSAGKYLQPEVTGGKRPLKGLETGLQRVGQMPSGYYAVPSTDIQLDSYGNVPGNLVRTILSYLEANTDAASARRVDKYAKQSTAKFLKGFGKAAMNADKVARREANQRSKKAKYFTVQPGESKLAPGVYERLSYGVITQLFAFVRTVHYNATFPFEEVGARRANEKFPSKLTEAIAASLLDRLQNA